MRRRMRVRRESEEIQRGGTRWDVMNECMKGMGVMWVRNVASSERYHHVMHVAFEC